MPARKIKWGFGLVLFLGIALASIYTIVSFNKSDRWRYKKNPPPRILGLAEMIRSHWRLDVQVKQGTGYVKGDIENFDAVFLIMETDNEELPPDLFDDILTTDDQEIIWSGLGSEDLVSELLSRDIRELPKIEQFTSLEYKSAHFAIDELDIINENEWPVTDSLKVLASLSDGKNRRSPFIIDINERYLILPFRLQFYFLVDNPSLVFLDVLHYSLGHHDADNKALLRLEDINAYTYEDPQALKDAYDYLKEENIPFHLALIARYINNQENIDLEVGESKDFLNLLLRMDKEGLATFVQHGYTHQIGDEVSGEGYEFWNSAQNFPLTNDSRDYVLSRVKGAQDLMEKNDLPKTDIWETPHYALSHLDNGVINSIYPFRYEHVPKIGSLPFILNLDGTVYFPENLGYIATFKEDSLRIKNLLTKLILFEDPIASFFWHPYRNIEELKYLIQMIQDSGFEFKSVYDLVEKDDKKQVVPMSSHSIGNRKIENLLILTFM